MEWTCKQFSLQTASGNEMAAQEQDARRFQKLISDYFIFFSAFPLCAAIWSVLSLLISYCGSSLLARWV